MTLCIAFAANYANAQTGDIPSDAVKYNTNIVAELNTGTWCGWCPRGAGAFAYYSDIYVGSTYQGHFIPIAVHYNDKMEVSSYTNSMSKNGYPSMSVNRVGSATDPKNMEKVASIAKRVTYWKTEVGATSSSNGYANIDFTIRCGYDNPGAQVKYAIVLTEDGVGPFSQQNSYSNNYDAINQLPSSIRPYMYQYAEAPSPFSTLYNYVARCIYPSYSGQSYTADWLRDTPQTISVNMPIPYDIENMSNVTVVVMVFDASTGETIAAESKRWAEEEKGEDPIIDPQGDQPITDPQGEKLTCVRSGTKHYPYMQWMANESYKWGASEIVMDGNTVYLKDPVSDYPAGTYIKGVKEGDKVTFTLPQLINALDGENYYVTRMIYYSDVPTYVEDGINTITFQCTDGDFGMTMETSDDRISFGIISEHGEWMDMSESQQVYGLFSDELLTPPAGLTTDTWTVHHNNGDYDVEIGFDGGDVWIKGIAPSLPNTWIKGHASGNSITLPTSQYIGITSSGKYYYFMTGMLYSLGGSSFDIMETDDITLAYNATEGTITGGEDDAYVINLGNAGILTLDYYIHFWMERHGGAGIADIDADAVQSVHYFDLQGRPVENPDNGVYIKRTVLTSGKAITTKEIR